MQIKIKGSYFESNWKHIEQDNPRTYPRPYEKILVWLNASAFQSQAVKRFFGHPDFYAFGYRISPTCVRMLPVSGRSTPPTVSIIDIRAFKSTGLEVEES